MSDPEHEFSEYLVKQGLTGGKWVDYLKPHGIASENNVLSIKGTENATTIFDAFRPVASEEELTILKKLLGVPNEIQDNDGHSIAHELERAGLDPEYWSSIFSDKLGVSTIAALKLVGRESYPTLEAYINYPWEKRALREMFNLEKIGNTMKEQREKQKNILKHRQKVAEQLLQFLRECCSQGQERNDEKVQQIECALRETLQVPQQSWIPQYKTLEELVYLLQTRNEQIGRVLKSMSELNDTTIFKIASDGLALKGIFLTGSLEDQLQDRGCILKAPKQITFLGEVHDQKEQIKHFTSKLQESSYWRSVCKLGYSVSESMQAGFWDFKIDINTAYTSSKKLKSIHEASNQGMYFSTVKFITVPLASYCFSDKDMCLSDDALKELSKIESIIATSEADNSKLKHACESFFHHFGSHAVRGPLHFGGVYWLKCFSDDIKDSEKFAAKQLQNEAVCGHAELYHGYYSGTPDVFDIANIKSKYSDSCSETTIAQTILEVNKNGGHPEISALADWKLGLVADNSTWSVIDRGTFLVPVWDIIQRNHVAHFKDVTNLVDVLYRAWKELAKLQIDADAITTASKVKEVVEAVEKLNKITNMTHQDIEESLTFLTEVKRDLVKQSMNLEAWSSLYLSQSPIQYFLQSVVNAQQKNPPASDTEDVRKLLQHLLQRDDINHCFTESDRESMLAWIHGIDDTQQITSSMECQEIINFSKYLDMGIEKMKTALETCSLAFGQNVPSTKFHDGIISAAIERAVNSLLRSLQKSPAQKYEFLCFITLIYPFIYDYQGTFVILNPLSLNDLEYLSEMIETQRKELARSQTQLQMQAFLFLLAVDIYCNKREIDTNLSQLKKHVHFMQQVLWDELQDTIQAQLADMSNDNTLNKLASKLAHLKETDPAQATEWQNGSSLEQILKEVPEVVKLQDSLDVDDNHLLASLDCSDISTLFNSMDIIKYYPQKLSLQQALCIQQDTRGEKKCCNPELLLFYILHKIMSYDYRCRADLLHMGDSDDDDDDNDSGSGVSWASAQEYVYIQVHPMDGLLAVLHCADDFLRQDLMTRLATCQLAIPFLLPDPVTKQLTLPLWAMKSIIKEWKSTLIGCEGVHEGPITSYKTPIISFLRLSRQGRSKSNTMNEVISESKYEHFHHRNMEGGSYKRLLGDGIVDACWYLPVGKANDTFPDVVTFLNLHGDARYYPQQLAFLSQISIASFVFISEEDVNDAINGHEILSGTEVLKILVKSPSSAVVLLIDKVPKGGKVDNAKKCISNKIQIITMEDKNDDMFKKAIRQCVNKTLRDTWTKERSKMITIDSIQCVELAHNLNIKIDEDDEELIKGRALADSLIEILMSHKDQTPSLKAAMLPLQDKKLWRKWASLDKEEHRQVNRGGEKFDRYGLRKRSEKEQIRELQLYHVKHLTPLMESFIGCVLSSSGKVRECFLQCIKLSLNNLSRQEISKLQHSYKENRSKLQVVKEVNQEKVKECKTKIEELHEQMINASLGLEHLLRELGQVYEATQELRYGTSEQMSRLPRAAAELLISGYPLEIMDGDAAHVPSKWIKAVLDEVGRILKDPDVFALTVLGLQSTGKSTLMNTAFGLKFNVSAGRCTRGAFMQLLTVSKELRKEIKCDYILVIDTEGLRAPELDTLKAQKHDNELATFVIGLADVTLINIFGEAPGDMDDILQTAVHAFIRMNSVKINPSCQFIHQNIGAVLANDKAEVGRLRFRDKLDSMTRAAAKEENCEGQYEYFSEVIQFSDHDSDVHHFPGLWKGDPPMAPVNPGYCEKAQQLVLHLIELIKRKNEIGATQLTTFNTRLQDLWKALLNENFVFSFKNTMEITVYNSLEAEYIQWSWSFRRQMYEWQQSADNKIKSVRDKSGLLALQKCLLTELPEFIQKIHEETQAKLMKYFEESKQQEMLAQWQSDAENRLKRLARDEEGRARDLCVQLSGAQRARAEVGNLNKRYCERMLANLKEVVTSVEEEIKQRITEQEKKLGPNVDEEQMRIAKEEIKEKELQHTFTILWGEWIQEIAQTLPPQHDNIDVETDTHKALIEVFKSHETMVIKELKLTPLREWGKTLSLPILRQHIALKKKGMLKSLSRVLQLGKAGPNEIHSHIKHAEHITTVLFEKTKQFLLERRNEKYSAIHIQDLIQIIIITITDFTTNPQCELILTPDYRIAVCITACGFAMKQFEETVEAMRKQNDPIAYLEQELRKPLYTMFKNKYNHTTQDKATAATFCELLAEPIRRQIRNSLGPIVVSDIVATNRSLKTKVDLVTRMLIDMGDQVHQSKEPDLTEYFVYLLDSKHSLQRWIKKYTDEHCEQGGEDKETKLVYLGKCQLASLISFIGKKVQDVSRTLENTVYLENWLNKVCNLDVLEGQLQLDLEIFDALTNEVNELKDVSNFTAEVKEGLDRLHADLSKDVERYTADDMETWQKRPYDILFDQLCGCCKQCPFCKEQCDYLNEGHKVEHHIKYHRPVCLCGYRYTHTEELSPDICSYLITSETTFTNSDTGENPHPFKNYAELYPKWKITPDKSLQAGSYWKWFLGQYADKVAAAFDAKPNKIPKEWKTAFQWEDIKKELESDQYI